MQLFVQILCLIGFAYGIQTVTDIAGVQPDEIDPVQVQAAFNQKFVSATATATVDTQLPDSDEPEREHTSRSVRGSITPAGLPDGISHGYTLYSTSGTAEVLLTDVRHEFVHRWPIDADRARLLPNCNLLAVHGSKWGLRREPWASLRSVIREYNWKGAVVREIRLPEDAHHDITQLSNGNLLVLYLTDVPKKVVKEKLGQRFENVRVRSDVIAEIDPSGNEVWRWEAHDHLDLSECGARSCPDLTQEKYITGKERFDWTHINTIREIPNNQWYEEGDERFRPGNIMIMVRNFWTSMIIDRNSGKIVWRFHGTQRHKISGGHESHMIEPDLPGAGNVLIFDNGRVHEQSSILEVNPTNQEIVWKYSDGKNFFSRVAGSAQRLPNGNTLISEDATGRVFEVNEAGEEVWSHHAYQMRVNRAHRYPEDYCKELLKLSSN